MLAVKIFIFVDNQMLPSVCLGFLMGRLLGAFYCESILEGQPYLLDYKEPDLTCKWHPQEREDDCSPVSAFHCLDMVRSSFGSDAATIIFDSQSCRNIHWPHHEDGLS